MKRIRLLIATTLSAFAITSCVDNPLRDEQYKKQVYLVGAYEGLQTKDVAYSLNDDESDTFIAAATGGSLKIDEDVQVSVTSDDDAISRYNAKFIPNGKIKYQKLTSSQYDIPTMGCVIKAGSIYERIPIKIRTQELHCDSLYMLSFKIANASCEISRPDTTLLFSINLINDYSARYQLSMTRYELVNGVPAEKGMFIKSIRNLKAVGGHAVRLFNLVDTEETKNIASSCLVLTIDPVDNSVKVTSWDKLSITKGEGTYDSIKKAFNIWYYYKIEDKEYKVEGTIQNNEGIPKS